MIYDLIIIGAGPVGLFSTFFAGYLRLKTLCLESDSILGGQPLKMYAKKYIYDLPGYKKISGEEIVEKLKEQVNQYPDFCEIKTNVNVVKYEILSDETILLTDEKNNTYHTRNVLFTIGNGSFEPKKLEFKESLNHPKVIYTLDDDENYFDKTIVVLGGGDAASDYAMHLADLKNTHVNLVHRGNKINSLTYSHDDFKNHQVNLHLEHEVIAWDPEFILIQDKNTQNQTKLPYDYLLVQYGLNLLGTKINTWLDFKRERNKFVVDPFYQTNIPHFYAAGDCVFRENRINMIISGIGEATIALQKIKATLPKTEKVNW